MTPEEFASLLSLLGPDRERAGERYEDIRRKLIRLFEWWGGKAPEDLADETFNRVARKAAQKGFKLEKPDPWSYVCGVARFVFLEDQRKRKETPISERESEPIDPVMPDPDPEDPRLPCFRRCLDRLTREERQLLSDFHPEEGRIHARQQLAQKLAVSSNALRIKVHRVRQKVKEWMAQCLEDEGR